MIAIIDYGVGNLFSLKSSLSMIGEQAVVTGDKETVEKADKIILPGVGAFGDAIEKLESTGLADICRDQARSGKYIMGICLGMQLLFDKSYEYGEHRGLGLIHGSVVDMTPKLPRGLKVPHIGWNALDIKSPSHPIFKNIKSGDCVYFVHSFYASECDDLVIADTEYGIRLTAAAANENVIGCQFHPEKSGKTGLAILKAFCEL